VRTPKLIFDDGTPRCLPRWARDEMVRLRLENDDLLSEQGYRDPADVVESVRNLRARLSQYVKDVA
jgi:hypothetical protein